MNKIFLYRLKNTDDRDRCVYIDDENYESRFHCNHYFGSIILCGPCFSQHFFPAYEKVETVLSKSEYVKLININLAIRELGNGIKKDNPTYKKGLEICDELQVIFEKLKSEKAKNFFNKIMASEKKFMKNEYSLSDDDINEIFENYHLPYRDRGIISYVYNNSTEVAKSIISDCYDIPSNLEDYFDYKRFGIDLVDEDEHYHELPDGRVVEYNY